MVLQEPLDRRIIPLRYNHKPPTVAATTSSSSSLELAAAETLDLAIALLSSSGFGSQRGPSPEKPASRARPRCFAPPTLSRQHLQQGPWAAARRSQAPTALLHYYITILRNNRTTTLLHCYTIALPHFDTCTLRHSYVTTLPRYYTSTLPALLQDCTTTRLHYYTTTPPPYYTTLPHILLLLLFLSYPSCSSFP